MRRAAVEAPRALIQQLTAEQEGPASDAWERGWWLGTAAINLNDDAALQLALARLDARARSGDRLAEAAAGFLRSRHAVANGISGGLERALRAAALLQAQPLSPAQTAWMRYQLCDAYTLDELAAKALPLCRQAGQAFAAIGDEWGVADVENDQGIALRSLGRYAQAAQQFESARRRFAALGSTVLVNMVGDNLAQAYLELGRPAEAMALSRISMADELASGRTSDALFSQADIARAQAALGQHRQAYATIRQVVAQARKEGLDGQLTDLLLTESRLAEQAGQLRQALDDLHEVLQLQASTSTPALRAQEAELEQRYASRENALRIRDLERENQLKDLALQAAKAAAAQREEAQKRQHLLIGLVSAIAVAALAICLLLILLLRAQRRHAKELRRQALLDPLTGVENRRGFLLRAHRLLQEPLPPPSRSHVLLLVDFDHFKHVNDSIGHPGGDRVLTAVLAYLREASTGVGHVARLGGEEFALLCPRLGGPAGWELAQQLRRGVATLPLPTELPLSGVTVSFGMALLDQHRGGDLDGWMRAADQALYRAKAAGRDQVVWVEQEDRRATDPA